MGRRHPLVFVVVVFLIAAIHSAWQSWHSPRKPVAGSASPGDSSTVCTVCGPIHGARPAGLAGQKKQTNASHLIDISGLEPYEVDTARSPLIAPAEGLVPPPAARPSN